MVGVSTRALWLVGSFSCDCMLWDGKGGGLTGQPLGPLVRTATLTAAMDANRVDLGVLAHGVVRSGVHTRAQTLLGYFVSD